MSNKLNKPFHHYGEEFNTNSAEIILPYLFDIYKFESVIDVGCGIGTWLEICEKKLKINKLLGLDGNHVLDFDLLIDRKKFVSTDLSKQDSYNINYGSYDLLICLEVAEHLSEINSDSLVDFLTKHSDVILFSAAIPGQTGENHINEQYPDYWQKKFESKNFLYLDIFREKFWSNKQIEWWYRQNMFLIVNKQKFYGNDIFKESEIWNGNIYIIPELLNLYNIKKRAKKVNNFNDLKTNLIKKIKKVFIKLCFIQS